MSFTKVSVAGIGTTGTITFTNVNAAGVITATSFSGSGANLTGVASTDNIRTNTNATFLQSVNVTGIVTAAGVNASGVITATSFSGSGANLTGLAATANVTTSSLVVIGVSTVAAGSAAAPSITPTGDSDTGIFFPAADTIAFGEGGAEAARIDSSGRLLLGTSTARGVGSGAIWPLIVESSVYGALGLISNRTDADGAYLSLGKSRGSTVGSNTIVQPGDELGQIIWGGADGTDLESRAALIKCEVDGTPGANDMPGRLIFSTTADGAASPTEAMRINNQRELLIGTTTRTANGGVLQVSNGITFPATQSACSDVNTLDDYEEGTWTPVIAGSSTAGTASYSTQTGEYVKIGKLVTVRALINWSGHTGTGFLRMTGLPFTLPSGQTLQWTSENVALTAGSFPDVFAYGFFYQNPGGAATALSLIGMDAAGIIYIVGSSYIVS